MIVIVFTGIVEATAEVATLGPSAGGARLALRHMTMAAGLTLGESVAVNGCCLTVTAVDPDHDGGTVAFDLLAETMRVTTLGRLRPGTRVNLERALRAGDRLSGHYVQGHIDTVAEVLDYTPHGQDHQLEITLTQDHQRSVIPRGSIAIDGISLTVAALGPRSLTCWIIPHTAAVTNLHARRPGDLVNVEYDVIGKYVSRWLGGAQA